MLNRTVGGLALSLALYAGCTSSDSDSEGGGGVGAVNDGVVTVGNGGLGGNDGGGGNGGGNDGGGGGGSGLPECSLQGFPPPSGPYACGSVGCADGSVCVETTQFGDDSCVIHFCASVPQACAADPTCACLADFLDYTLSDDPACTDAGGDLKLTGELVPNPPWTEPPCPGVTCGDGDGCWACFPDGFHGFWQAPKFECAPENPSIGGLLSCNPRPMPL